MIQIPDKGILLVPSHWHLPFYQEILKQKSNTLGIEMISLLSYVQRFIKKENKDEIALLYECRNILQDIPENNDFYNSCKNADFLRAALKFIRWTKSENIHSFPNQTAKQKQLQPILEKLDSLELVEDSYSTIELDSQENVYILEKVFSIQEQYWVDRLLEKGAQLISFKSKPRKEYYAVSNAKKQARLIAQTIIEKNWDASDCSIHLCDTKDRAVTMQMLDAYQIPYTILKQEQLSSIALQWATCLKWVQNPCLETLLQVLETCFLDSQDILAYLKEYPDAYPDWNAHFTLDYQENTFLNQKDYASLQELEKRALKWVDTHSFQWDFKDFEAIANQIQAYNQHPSKEDIDLFTSIQNLISQANPYIHEPKDLDLLIHEIQECSKNQNASSLQGVTISSLNDLCGLKKHVFLVGVTGQSFPALSIETGIFNEMFIKDLNLPSLQSRLIRQKEQRFHTLDQCEDIVAIFPESKYDRKDNQTSIELDQWIGSKPTYIEIEESDISYRPSFTLPTDIVHSLFFKENKVSSSVSALESYAKCPFQYFLKYGLRLKDNKDWSDIAQRGTLLHKILERSSQDYQKGYASISKEQLQQYIDEEFDFVSQLYPHRKFEFELSKKDIFSTLSLIFEKLAYFEEHWHMNIDQEEYEYTIDIPLESCTLHLYGFVDRIDTSKSSFTIFDYKSGNRKFEEKKFKTGESLQLATYAIAYEDETKKVPVGSFYILLRPTLEEQIAHKMNRNSMKYTEGASQEELEEKNRMAPPYKGIAYQDPSLYHDDHEVKKTISFLEQKEDWTAIVQSLITEIKSGHMPPEHSQKACEYCQFETICRNARKEVKKPDRTKEVNA